MLIVGAKGHAKEIFDVITQSDYPKDLVFFDNISTDLPEKLFGEFRIVRSFDEAKIELMLDPRFVLGVGNPQVRNKLAEKFLTLGGVLESVVSPRTSIGKYGVKLGRGLNIMTGVVITNDVEIGEGVLLNANSTIHHDVYIGKYSEISPGAHLTGGCRVGNFCLVGTGAIILPKIQVGDNVVIGAGAVVTKNITKRCVVVGVPAKPIRKP